MRRVKIGLTQSFHSNSYPSKSGEPVHSHTFRNKFYIPLLPPSIQIYCSRAFFCITLPPCLPLYTPSPFPSSASLSSSSSLGCCFTFAFLSISTNSFVHLCVDIRIIVHSDDNRTEIKEHRQIARVAIAQRAEYATTTSQWTLVCNCSIFYSKLLPNCLSSS